MNTIAIFKAYTKACCLALILIFGIIRISAQESAPDFSSKTTYHNQLFFNRFLIHPTFSLVREEKSYLNILHRNQYTTFEDNNQNYFLGFSNKINEHTALGIGIYSQWSGVVQEFGFNANYARSVQLGTKSSLTFGTNVTYFSNGLDRSRVVASENDPELAAATKESTIAIQPGITLSVGKFDFSVYARDLLNYNQSTDTFLMNFSDKSLTASVQYTHLLRATRGFFANAQVSPLLQVSRNQDNRLAYIGSIVLELPSYGWLQSTFDQEFGLSMGFGFNLNKKMSLGYLMEKEVANETVDLGWNHELSVAYTFKNTKNDVADRVNYSQDRKVDQIIRNYEDQILKLMEGQAGRQQKEQEFDRKEDHEIIVPKEPAPVKRKEKTKRTIEQNSRMSFAEAPAIFSGQKDLAYENRLILDELMLRQDSIENRRTQELEERFEAIVRILRNDLRNHAASSQLADATKSKSASSVSLENDKVYTLNNIAPKAYEKLPIGVLNQSDIVGVKAGYYVIANVYKTEKYLLAFMKKLQDRGIKAQKFFNKENGLYYVYLADFQAKQDAENAYVSNLNGQYKDEKWIMQVDNLSATVANTYEE